MSKVILDDAQREQLAQDGGVSELCDRDGRTIGYALSPEEYHRLLYDLAWAESSTPEAEAERQEAMEAYRRGDYVTSAQLFAEIEEFLRRRAASCPNTTSVDKRLPLEWR